MIKRMVKFLISSNRKSFNVYVFFFTWLALSLYEVLVLKYISINDSGYNPKYVILCNIGLFIYALICGNIVKHKKYCYLPSLLLPISFSILEFINFNHVFRFDFFAQLYHFWFIDIVYILICYVIFETNFTNPKIKLVIRFIKNSLELFLLWLFTSLMVNALLNGGINGDAVIAICQTNTKEAWHYFWGMNHGFILVIFMVLLFVLHLFFVFKLDKRFPPDKSINDKYSFCFLSELCGLVVVFGGIGLLGNMYAYFRPLSYRLLKVRKSYYVQIEQYQNLIDKRAEIAKRYASLDHEIGTSSSGIYVLIIGESLDRRYMECYGSQHKTTPFQEQLRNQKDAIFFDRIYACHVQTTRVVPKMLTINNQYLKDDLGISEAELDISLLDIAKHNGFHVYWISNQERMSNSNSIITSIASAAEQCIFMGELKKGKAYDQDILSAVKDIQFAERSLVIIHLSGNHSPYGLTYPKDFIFPDGFNTYEKSVYYNDKVIQSLTCFFQSAGAMLISYVSDHADAVSAGKGHDSRPNKFLREMVEIPMWFFLSDDYQKNNNELYLKLNNASGKVITNDLIFNIFCDLMKLPVNPALKIYSPLSNDYILDSISPKTLDGLIEIPNP